MLNNRLDKLIKILSINMVKNMSENEQLTTLSSIGFQPSEIADLLGKTPNSIRVALHRLREKNN